MAWKAEFSVEAEHDFELILDHLFDVYISLGETRVAAFERAVARVQQIRTLGERIGRTPYRGTLRDGIAPGLRNVTIDHAVFWFELDQHTETVRVLAVFFGGQDHVRHMVARLLGHPDASL
jgi:plasmid stabilization system protein ParE